MGSHLPRRDFIPGGAVPLLAPLRGHLLPRGARAVEPDGPSILRGFLRTAVGRPHRGVRGPRLPSAVSFGPPLPWEGRRDSAGRLVVFTAFEGFVVGGLLIALSLVRTPVLTELIGGCPHEELLGRTCSPMRGEGLPGTGILGGAGGPGRYRENRLHRHRLRRLPRMMALWKEALHYVPKYSPDGGWIILKDPEGRGPNLSLNLSSEGHLD